MTDKDKEVNKQEKTKQRTGVIKRFFTDFKKFITKGNIIDLAVAVVIGAAFGKIVTSLVNDIIMPIIALAVGGASVTDWKWVIKPAVYNEGVLVTAESALMYGNFLQTILDFIIIAFFIFLALRVIMSLQKEFDKINKGIAVLSKKEHKAAVRQLKKEGKNRTQIREEIERIEQEKTALKKAEEEAVKAEEEARKAEEEANRKPSVEELLTDIKELLKDQANKK